MSCLTRLTRIATACVARILVAGAACFVTTASAGGQAIKPGALAPPIDLPLLDGGHIRLSDFHGHPAVVSFWGTWCPPCRSEFPELVRLSNAHAAEGLVVLGINGRDQEVSTREVQAFVNEYAVRFPIALDQRGKARRAYRLVGLPTTVFIDSGGVIRHINMGPISRDELDRGVAMIFPAR